MLTVIVVGSSQTRRVERGGRAWLYTPRGYEAGDAAAQEATRHAAESA